MVNNYVRIGYHPQIIILTFNDRDLAEVERIRKEVQEITGGRIGINVVLWKPCSGLGYRVVGETRYLS